MAKNTDKKVISKETYTADIDGREIEYELEIYAIDGKNYTASVWYGGFSQKIHKVVGLSQLVSLEIHSRIAIGELYRSLPEKMRK